MSNVQTLRGMETVSFFANDVKAARTWYSELLGINPYFERWLVPILAPGYVPRLLVDEFCVAWRQSQGETIVLSATTLLTCRVRHRF